MEQKLPYAEEMNYWQTGKSSPDVWIEKTRKIIEGFGGRVEAELFGSDVLTGRAAFMIQWSLGEDRFKIVWPVLPTKSGNERSARVQAATFLYHDTKAKAVSVAILGHRATFFNQLMLPDGRRAVELSSPELLANLPEAVRPRIEYHAEIEH